MKRGDNPLLGRDFFLKDKFGLQWTVNFTAAIVVIIGPIGNDPYFFFCMMALCLHNAINTESNIPKIVDTLLEQGKEKGKIIFNTMEYYYSFFKFSDTTWVSENLSVEFDSDPIANSYHIWVPRL